MRADTQKKYGVWGYGIVGRSAARYLHDHGCEVEVYDANESLVVPRGIHHSHDLDQFLSSCDVIIPSGAIDLRPYPHYKHKWFSELDLFQEKFTKPVIAITGTLGKTTVTHIVAHALMHLGERVFKAGNIGVGLCDILDDQDSVDSAVIECSSFQLEPARLFAPDIAVITNIFPNHLDRHGSMDAYRNAKQNIYRNQNSGTLIVHADLAGRSPKRAIVPAILPDDIDQPPYGLTEHWQFVNAILQAKGYTHEQIRDCINSSLQIPPGPLAHRLERVAVRDGVTYVNDSKSTIMEATCAAVHSFTGKRIVLLLGGLSKGVSRRDYVQQLAGTVEEVVCFGDEADQLSAWCAEVGIVNNVATNLELAVALAYRHARPGDVVLLSPGGASFDLFKNFERRGERFKQLVQQCKLGSTIL